jgi:hypothetical protein
MVRAFTRNSVTMELAEGGKFELFGGNVLGIFETFVSDDKFSDY